MNRYLIEFRFQSKKARSYLEGMIYGINRKFRVGKRRHIPHISLVGPLTTNNEQRLICDFARVCSETPLMKFQANGFGTFDSNRVVYVDIGASDKLNEFRVKLAELLRAYCKLQQQDKRKDGDKFGYHSTLAMNLNPNEFNSIKNHIKNKPAPHFTQIVMRVTLLKNGRILREYDFLQRKLFNRRQALSRRTLRNSKELLRRFFEGKYNPNKRVSTLTKAAVGHMKQKKESIWDKIKSFFIKK